MVCPTCGQPFPLHAPPRPQVSPVCINIYLQTESSILPTPVSFAVAPTAGVPIGHGPIGHGPVGHDPSVFLHDFIPVPVPVNPTHAPSTPEHALPAPEHVPHEHSPPAPPEHAFPVPDPISFDPTPAPPEHAFSIPDPIPFDAAPALQAEFSGSTGHKRKLEGCEEKSKRARGEDEDPETGTLPFRKFSFLF
jgi:hypothetical protein